MLNWTTFDFVFLLKLWNFLTCNEASDFFSLSSSVWVGGWVLVEFSSDKTTGGATVSAASFGRSEAEGISGTVTSGSSGSSALAWSFLAYSIWRSFTFNVDLANKSLMNLSDMQLWNICRVKEEIKRISFVLYFYFGYYLDI